MVFDIDMAVFVRNFTEREREDLSSKVCCARDILVPRRFCMCIYAHSHIHIHTYMYMYIYIYIFMHRIQLETLSLK